MIRINLLPKKRRSEQRGAAGQGWLLVVLVVLLAEVSALFVWHSMNESKLKAQIRKNSELAEQIEQSKRLVQNHPEIKEKLAELRAKEDAIAALQSARTGPTSVLLELARILTPGRGPTVNPARLEELRRENPLSVYSPSWDARRLWLTKFAEENRQVQILGVARDGEDVSEFARRLSLSGFFADVRLMPGQRATATKAGGLELVEFELVAKVKY
ncbi:MAG: PilN domain-containing protein [Polyangiaceae bacterium]